MIERSAIIEGLINQTAGNIKIMNPKLYEFLEKKLLKFTNDRLCDEYFKSSGNHIRQIFSNQFIILT